MNSSWYASILSDLRSPESTFDLLQKAGILLFSFGVWSFREIAVLGLLLLLATTLKDWKRSIRVLTGTTTGVLALGLAGYIAISTVLFSLEFRDHAPLMLEEGLRHLYLFGFLLFALALRKNPHYLWPAVTLAIIGFFLGRIPHIPDLIESNQRWWSARHALGFPTAIPMGQYAFAVMLGLLVFAPRIFALSTRGASILWLMAMGLTTQLLIISQSRSVWLVAPIFVAAMILIGWRMEVFSRKQVGGLLVAIVAISIATAFIQTSTIQKRLTTEPETWNQIFEGEIDEIPSTQEGGKVKSIGIRINMIEFGFEKWLERPVFGWGPGASKMLIECCTPESFKRFNDLHSAYPETLMRFGLVGTLIWIALVLSLVRDGIMGAREGTLPKDIALFVLVCLALHFVVAIANYRVINYDWRFYWIFFTGIAMAFSPHFAVSGNTSRRKPLNNN